MGKRYSLSMLLLFGMVAGFVLDVGVVLYFGFSGQVDRFILALTVPMLLDMLFRESVRNVLVPHFTSLEKHGSIGELLIYAKRLACSALVLGLSCSLLILLVALVLHHAAVGSNAGGSSVPFLLALLSPLPTLSFPATIGAVFSNSQSRFSVFGLRMLVVYGFGLGGLLCAMFAQKGVTLVAAGYVIGFCAYAILSMWSFKGRSLQGRRCLLSLKELAEVYELTRVMFLAFGFRVSVRFIERMVVFPMGEGLLSAYYVAFRVFSSLQSVIGMVSSTTKLPSLSRIGQANKRRLLMKSVNQNARRIAVFALLAGALLAVVSTALLQFSMDRGFTSGAHETLAIKVFYIFVMALPAACVTPMLSAGLFALNRRNDVFKTMIITSLIHIGIVVVLGYLLSLFGVAFAVVISSSVSVFFLSLFLRRTMHAERSHAS